MSRTVVFMNIIFLDLICSWRWLWRITVFWDMLLCNLIDIKKKCRDICCLHLHNWRVHQTTSKRGVLPSACSSNVLPNFYQAMQHHIQQDSYPSNRLCTPTRLWDVDDITLSRQSAHRCGWGCQQCSTPQKLFFLLLILIFVRGWVNHKGQEGLGKLKKFTNLINLEPTTFWLEACLNQLCYCMLLPLYMFLIITVPIGYFYLLTYYTCSSVSPSWIMYKIYHPLGKKK
jgi:hypothetical protein